MIPKNRLHQLIYTQFTQIFQHAGVSLSIKQLETLQTDVNKLCDVLIEHTKNETIEYFKQLQDAVGQGFDNVQKDMEKIRQKVESQGGVGDGSNLEWGDRWDDSVPLPEDQSDE